MLKIIRKELQRAVIIEAKKQVKLYNLTQYHFVIEPYAQWKKKQLDAVASLIDVNEKFVYGIFEYGNEKLKTNPQAKNLERLLTFLGHRNECQWENLEELLLARALNDFIQTRLEGL